MSLESDKLGKPGDMAFFWTERNGGPAPDQLRGGIVLTEILPKLAARKRIEGPSGRAYPMRKAQGSAIPNRSWAPDQEMDIVKRAREPACQSITELEMFPGRSMLRSDTPK